MSEQTRDRYRQGHMEGLRDGLNEAVYHRDRADKAEAQLEAAHQALTNLGIDTTKPCGRCHGRGFEKTMSGTPFDCLEPSCTDGQVPCSLEERIGMLGERLKEVTDEQIEAVLAVIGDEAELPYMARIRDFPDPEVLRAADSDAEQKNREFARRLILASRAPATWLTALAPENPEGR